MRATLIEEQEDALLHQMEGRFDIRYRFWLPTTRTGWINFYSATINGLCNDIREHQRKPITNDTAQILSDLRALVIEMEGRLATVQEGTAQELGWV